MEKTANISVVIADYHQLMRSGITGFLNSIPNVEVVAEATDGEHLLEILKETETNLVVTDIKMPRIDGICATRLIRSRYPGVQIIAFSFMDDEASIIRMLEAGALGYITKCADREELKCAIYSVNAGLPYYCNTTSSQLMESIAKSHFNLYSQKIPVFDQKEIEIINLFCQQYTSQQVAERLFKSVRTVEEYRRNIFLKMGVKNVVGMVIYSIKNNLVDWEQVVQRL